MCLGSTSDDIKLCGIGFEYYGIEIKAVIMGKLTTLVEAMSLQTTIV